MLVLSRKSGEEVTINKDLVIKVLSIHGARVKLGFEGPQDFSVHRTEASRPREKKEELEASVSQESIASKKNLQELLNRYLSSEYYENAYNLVKIYPNLPTPKDLLKLSIGLGDRLYQHKGESKC